MTPDKLKKIIGTSIVVVGAIFFGVGVFWISPLSDLLPIDVFATVAFAAGVHYLKVVPGGDPGFDLYACFSMSVGMLLISIGWFIRKDNGQ